MYMQVQIQNKYTMYDRNFHDMRIEHLQVYCVQIYIHIFGDLYKRYSKAKVNCLQQSQGIIYIYIHTYMKIILQIARSHFRKNCSTYIYMYENILQIARSHFRKNCSTYIYKHIYIYIYIYIYSKVLMVNQKAIRSSLAIL
jgi:hypothetical protein